MDFIDHDKTQITEERRNLHVLVDHQRLQGFRRDLQDTGWLFQQFALFRLRHIPVPPGNSDSLLFAKFIQTSELVIDQRFERRYIEHAYRFGRVFIQDRQNREKSSFRFPGCRGSRQKYIFIRIEDGIPRGILHRAQRLPARAVNIILNERSVSFKDIHIVNSVKPASVSSETASDFE